MEGGAKCYILMCQRVIRWLLPLLFVCCRCCCCYLLSGERQGSEACQFVWLYVIVKGGFVRSIHPTPTPLPLRLGARGVAFPFLLSPLTGKVYVSTISSIAFHPGRMIMWSHMRPLYMDKGYLQWFFLVFFSCRMVACTCNLRMRVSVYFNLG